MNIVDIIKREDRLRAMCAEVFGAENANSNAQRLASRYEKEFRDLAGVLVQMRGAA